MHENVVLKYFQHYTFKHKTKQTKIIATEMKVISRILDCIHIKLSKVYNRDWKYYVQLNYSIKYCVLMNIRAPQ